MTEVNRSQLLNPGQLIPADVLPRLTEFSRELPGLFAPSGEGPWMGLWGDREIDPVNAVEWLNDLVAVTRAYEAAHQLVQSQDELIVQTMASFGRL